MQKELPRKTKSQSCASNVIVGDCQNTSLVKEIKQHKGRQFGVPGSGTAGAAATT